MEYKIKIKYLEGAKKIEKATIGSQWDCFAFSVKNETAIGDSWQKAVYPNEIIKISLGFMLEMPDNMEAILRPRSGLATEGIVLANGIGTIDSDYRGEVTAILYSTSLNRFEQTIKKGEKICQLAFQEKPQIELIEVDELSETKRGTGGFGSTGK